MEKLRLDESILLRSYATLSGGEQTKLQLAVLFSSEQHYLLIDEPTNHLDIASREALEAALEGYNGTMLIVTHDRYLVNRLADRILHMTPNGLQEYIGGYDDYIAAVNESRAQADEQKRTQSRNALDYRERKQQQSILNRAKGEAARCEAAVSKAEAELDEINEELAKPYIASDYKLHILHLILFYEVFFLLHLHSFQLR